MYVDFSLPQQDLEKLQTGLKVLVTADAYPDKKFEGELTAINPDLNATTRSVQLRASFANADQLLRPGMFVRVEVELPGEENVLAIPSTAVLSAPYGDAIFVIEPHVANGVTNLYRAAEVHPHRPRARRFCQRGIRLAGRRPRGFGGPIQIAQRRPGAGKQHQFTVGLFDAQSTERLKHCAMKSFTDLFIRRPVLATVISLLILIAGLQAIRSLNLRQYPLSENATVTVTTVYVGASANLVRGFVTQPLERAIAAADGIDYMESVSTLGLSTITVHLRLNYDSKKALGEISSKWTRCATTCRRRRKFHAHHRHRRLAVRLGVFEFFFGHFAGEQITDYLTRIVQPRLTAIEGVQKADILGGRTFAMRIWLKPDRLAAYNVSPNDVRTALEANNFLSAVGRTKGSLIQVNLTANTDLRSVDEFKNLVVRQNGDQLVRLSDVADVVLGAEDYDSEVRFSGERAVFMGVWVLPNANSLDVIKAVRKEMALIQKDLPAGLTARGLMTRPSIFPTRFRKW